MDRLAGDVTRHVGGEKDCRAGHLVDVTRAAHRDRATESLFRPGGAICMIPSVIVMSGASALTRMP